MGIACVIMNYTDTALLSIWALGRFLNGKDFGNPSWKRSFPHMLVAAFSSFLFGYHLGCISNL